MTLPTREELEAKGFIELKETGLWIDGSLIERPEELAAAIQKFIMADRAGGARATQAAPVIWPSG